MVLLLALLLAQADAGADAGPARTMPAAALSPEPWEKVETTDGVTLERRAVKGSAYFEYRATTVTDVPAEQLCQSVFDWGSYAAHDEVKVRRLLADGDAERVVYDQVEQPLVANRDYALVQRRWCAGGACHLEFFAANDLAPPKPEGWVRLERLWGHYDFTPVNGRVELRYVIFADPAGAIPPFLVHGAQAKGVIGTVKSGIERAKGKPPRHP